MRKPAKKHNVELLNFPLAGGLPAQSCPLHWQRPEQGENNAEPMKMTRIRDACLEASFSVQALNWLIHYHPHLKGGAILMRAFSFHCPECETSSDLQQIR